jgi:hypothetical protein
MWSERSGSLLWLRHPVLTIVRRYSAKGSFIEVYNEKIRDLLDTRSDDLKV